MKLLDGIFYTYYWANYSKGGLYNKLYKDPVSISVVIAVLFSTGTFPWLSVFSRWIGLTFNLKTIFYLYYILMTGISFAYFYWGKRYKKIALNEEYKSRFYRISAILYPIICIVAMFVAFMIMCSENIAKYGAN